MILDIPYTMVPGLDIFLFYLFVMHTLDLSVFILGQPGPVLLYGFLELGTL